MGREAGGNMVADHSLMAREGRKGLVVDREGGHMLDSGEGGHMLEGLVVDGEGGHKVLLGGQNHVVLHTGHVAGQQSLVVNVVANVGGKSCHVLHAAGNLLVGKVGGYLLDRGNAGGEGGGVGEDGGVVGHIPSQGGRRADCGQQQSDNERLHHGYRVELERGSAIC